ncbi:MAG: aminoacyl-tRNA hydrolase [Alphaproteobacteria bacterium]
MFNWLKKRNTEDMWLIVGLGNPGDKYKANRHNAGFMAVDQIAGDNMFSPFKSKFQGEIAEGRIGSQKVAILKPQTYMNESGISVRKCADFYKIEPDKIIVFYDELDLAPGKIKVKKGGGAGGHNGIKSIDAHLGDKDYWRVRLGIGHPGDKNRVSGYVLSDFSKEEQKWWPDFINVVARHVEHLVQDRQDDYMTRVAENFRI